MSTLASTALRDLLSRQFSLGSEQWDALEAHYELLRRWNRVLNLTSIYNIQQAAERHYGESLFLASRLPVTPQRIADLGSGPGFPGLPVAVARPDCSVTLIESHQRKAVFLREAGRGLSNARVLAQRAESVREEFDIIVSRAVSYEDLGSSLSRLAPVAFLLTGADAPPDSLGFRWSEPVRLPWGKQRFLRIGYHVSRETA